jgi:hypothetical protein
MLIDMPMGSNTAFNEYLAQFTTQASKAALEDLNLLKSGNISEHLIKIMMLYRKE